MNRFIYLLIVVMFSGVITACQPKPKLKAVKPAHVRVESTITTTNSGTVDAEQQAVLGFSATGRVQKVQAQLGDQVRKGQILAQLENRDLAAILEDSSKEYKRTQELFQAGLVSKVAQDTAKKNWDVALSNYEKSLIRAPFDGMVTEMNLEVGELAQSATSQAVKNPLRIVDLKPRLIKGTIDEVDLGKVKMGASAKVRILAVRQKPFAAQVIRVVPFVSTTKEQDRTAQIELRITDPESLEGQSSTSIPVGASADVEVIIDFKEQAMALPSRVILGASDNRYVFRSDDGKIAKVPVKVGIGNYEKTEIVSGIKENDVVVYPSDEVELKEGVKVQTEMVTWP